MHKCSYSFVSLERGEKLSVIDIRYMFSCLILKSDATDAR